MKRTSDRSRGWLRMLARADRLCGQQHVPTYVLTLTIPPELRRHVARLDVLADLRRAAWATATGWLAAQPGVPASARWIGRTAIHPEGRESAGVWAPHLDVLAAGVVPGPGGWAPVRLPGLAADGELLAGWADALAEVTGQCVACARVEAAPERRGRRAAARYSMRAWPGWLTVVARVVSYGRLPRPNAPLVYGDLLSSGRPEELATGIDEIEGEIGDRSDSPSPKIKNVFMPSERQRRLAHERSGF